MKRQLFEKQAYEASKLESELRTQEIEDINAVIAKTADKKSSAITDAQEVCVCTRALYCVLHYVLVVLLILCLFEGVEKEAGECDNC